VRRNASRTLAPLAISQAASASDAVTGGYVKPTYSSQGQLLSLERLPASGGTATRHHVLYFAGRPVLLWKKVGTGAATIQYVTTDHLGTPIATLLNTGAVTWSGGTEPFGRDFQEGGASDMLTKDIPLRLPGQWDDALFGAATLGADVYYNVYRWYEPQTGRYSSADPLGLFGSSELFAYAAGRPTSEADLLGLQAVAAAAPWAAGCAAVDGPLPVGDIVALIIVGGAVAIDFSTGCRKCGNCSEGEHQLLQALVELSCGGKRKCFDGQSTMTYFWNYARNVACQRSRNNINNRCFGGGDDGHRRAADEAGRAAEKCLRYLTGSGGGFAGGF